MFRQIHMETFATSKIKPHFVSKARQRQMVGGVGRALPDDQKRMSGRARY